MSLTCRNPYFGTHSVGNCTKNIGIDMIFRQRLWLWGERFSTEQQSSPEGFFSGKRVQGGILSGEKWRGCSRTRKSSSSIIVTWISAAWLPSSSQYPSWLLRACIRVGAFPTGALTPHGASANPDKTLSCSTRPLMLNLISGYFLLYQQTPPHLR